MDVSTNNSRFDGLRDRSAWKRGYFERRFWCSKEEKKKICFHEFNLEFFGLFKLSWLNIWELKYYILINPNPTLHVVRPASPPSRMIIWTLFKMDGLDFTWLEIWISVNHLVGFNLSSAWSITILLQPEKRILPFIFMSIYTQI